MNVPRSILALTDFSDASRNAVMRAARLARDLQAALHIVHVAQPTALEQLRGMLGDAPADMPQRLDAAAHSSLDELADSVLREYGVAASLRLADGPLLEEIERAQRDARAGLTVLGARGGLVARHLLLGSTAERLLPRMRHPMLVVRVPAEVPYRRALVGVDFSQGSQLTLQCTRTLAPNAHLMVLHAYEAPFEGKLRTAGVQRKHVDDYLRVAESAAREQMAAFVRDAGAHAAFDAVLLRGHPLVHLLDLEEETGSQLVAVGWGGRSRAEDLFVGSVTRRVLTQSRADVLVSA